MKNAWMAMVLGLLLACGSDELDSTSDGDTPMGTAGDRCDTEGRTDDCACDDSSPGVRRCGADLTLGSCECVPTAGTTGAVAPLPSTCVWGDELACRCSDGTTSVRLCKAPLGPCMCGGETGEGTTDPPDSSVVPSDGCEPMCEGGQPACDEESGECVECLTDTHCGGDKGYCDVASMKCKECMTADHCGGDQACDPRDLKCVKSCADSSECMDDKRSLCEPTSSACVECLADTECMDDKKPTCSASLFRCVE